MGQKHRTHIEQFNFNTLIVTLVESRTDESVVNTLVDYLGQVDGHYIVPDYL